MNEANAKANAMPADPASPPMRIWSGANDAAQLAPSGPPLAKIAMDTMMSDASSSSMSTPRSLAPTSTLSSESAVTSTQAMQRPGPPRQQPELAGDDDAEEAVDRELHGDVREDRDEGRRDARVASEAAADVREERAGVGDALAHRGVADTEQQQGDADHEVRARHGRAVAEHDRDRYGARHADERRGGRDDEEDDADDAQSALAQALGASLRRWWMCSPSGQLLIESAVIVRIRTSW